MNTLNDTIAAVSTAKGTGAIAIVRLSGPDAFDILEKIYSGNISVKNMVERKCYNGTIIDSTRSYSVDNVIILKFQSPCSYTGQHIIEIHCHGGAFVVQHILRLLILNGAKPAEPGEFTKRAFLNGKIDLLQAESIADTIHAQSESSLKLSQHQLHGDLSKELSAIKETLIKQCSLLEIELDFSDEDIKLADYSTISDQMDILKNRLKSLLDTFTYGKLVKEGVKLVISGKPNAGKSSLMNTLLQQDRAIVTDIPGTTRDTIEEALDIRGFIFYITDTAGLHRSNNTIENAGIQRTYEMISQADIVLYIIDSLSQESSARHDFFKKLKPGSKTYYVYNKIDLVSDYEKSRIKAQNPDALLISAETKEGLDSLESSLVEYVENKLPVHETEILTKTRHYNAILKSYEFITHARESIEQGYSSEFIALDLRSALDSMGQLTGYVTSDDILNNIFSNFCVGK